MTQSIAGQANSTEPRSDSDAESSGYGLDDALDDAKLPFADTNNRSSTLV